jgi:glucosamine-phosphate N-acetyltransferase
MDLHAPLFSPSLMPSSIDLAIPEGFACRPLQRSDFKHGHLEVLSDLAHVGAITEEQWTERFDDMRKSNGTYFIVVIVDERSVTEQKIIGTGTLVIEKKL